MIGSLARLTLFAFFAGLAIFAPLVPLAPGSARVPPDLLYCVVVAWVLRAPASVPLMGILALGLLADMLLMRPPGLGALALLLASETARIRGPAIRSLGFVPEWISVGLGFAVLTALTQALLHLSLAPGADWNAALRLVIVTTLAYGPIALALGWLIRLTAPRRLVTSGGAA